MSRLTIAAQFVEQVRIARNTEDLRRLLEDISKEIGFRYFALVDHVDLRCQAPHSVRLENYPEAWATHFVEKGLYAEDPIHRAQPQGAREITQQHADDPAQQKDQHQDHQAPDPRRHVRIGQQAAQVRLDDGAEFPCRSNGEDPKNQGRRFAHEPAQ